MENLATISDVEKRLGNEIDPDEKDRVEGLLEEATILVEGYIGTVTKPVPRAVRVVTSRMVARVLQAPSDGFTQDSVSYSAGDYSKNVTYNTGGSGGSPWLTKTDKIALRKAKGGGIYTIGIG